MLFCNSLKLTGFGATPFTKPFMLFTEINKKILTKSSIWIHD